MSAQELQDIGDKLRDTVIAAVNDSIKEAVIVAVATEVTKQAPAAAKVVEQANAIRGLQTKNATLKNKLDNLTNILNALRNDVRNMNTNGSG